MKNQSSPLAKKTDAANPFLNAAILAAVALTIVPAAIFGAARYLQSRADAPSETVEVMKSSPKRSAVAERRARQLEARKAKQAKPAQTYPEISMETVESYDYDNDYGFGFGMDYDAAMEFNGPGMMPPAYMGGPGMMPPAYMGGPGMMPVPDRGGFNRGGFNGDGRMRGTETGFNNRFNR